MSSDTYPLYHGVAYVRNYYAENLLVHKVSVPRRSQQHTGQKRLERQKRKMGYGRADFQHAEQQEINDNDGEEVAQGKRNREKEPASGRSKRKRTRHE